MWRGPMFFGRKAVGCDGPAGTGTKAVVRQVEAASAVVTMRRQDMVVRNEG